LARILGFDGVRAVAIFLVIFAHLHVFLSLAHYDVLPYRSLPLVSGETGVMIFFVMSGFLITYLLFREHEDTGAINVGHFYWRRSIRILPIYFLSLIAVAFIRAHLATDVSDKALSFSVLFISNFIPNSDFSTVVGHYWSLAVEEHFYLIWPFVLLTFIGRSRVALAWSLAGFIIASHVLLVWLEVSTDLGDQFAIRRWTVVAGGDIALGCLMAMIVSSDRRRLVRALASNKVAVLGIVIFMSSVALGQAGEHLRPLGAAAVITWIFLNQDSRVVRFLELAPLAYIGRISYGLYIYQGILLGVGPHRAPGLEWPPDQLTGLVLLIAVAPLSFHCIEKPLLRMKSGMRRRWRVTKAPSE
jgi:peptidoglycan/LPS O-acetylase OafA/YrhL